jgi:hypothetical protein
MVRRQRVFEKLDLACRPAGQQRNEEYAGECAHHAGHRRYSMPLSKANVSELLKSSPLGVLPLIDTAIWWPPVGKLPV